MLPAILIICRVFPILQIPDFSYLQTIEIIAWAIAVYSFWTSKSIPVATDAVPARDRAHSKQARNAVAEQMHAELQMPLAGAIAIQASE